VLDGLLHLLAALSDIPWFDVQRNLRLRLLLWRGSDNDDRPLRLRNNGLGLRLRRLHNLLLLLLLCILPVIMPVVVVVVTPLPSLGPFVALSSAAAIAVHLRPSNSSSSQASVRLQR